MQVALAKLIVAWPAPFEVAWLLKQHAVNRHNIGLNGRMLVCEYSKR
jgi:hypothetical protein